MKCRKCQTGFLRRSPARGLVERLLGGPGLYPFRCQICGHRFNALQWGVRRLRVDRREYVRVPTRMPASLVQRQTRAEGVVTDLSIAGARLHTGARIGPGELLQLTIQHPKDQAPLAVDIAVVRNAHPMRLGLNFVEIKDEEKRRLGECMQDLLRSHLEPSPP